VLKEKKINMTKISFYTPTHNPEHLLSVYDSITRQTVGNYDYEWIIVPNGGLSINSIPEKLTADKNVKIHYSDLKGVGALKKYACARAHGDVLAELDHDDWLAPNAVEELLQANLASPNAFYYSDYVNFKPDGTCETFSSRFGWEKYQCTVSGKHYTACRAFPPTARAMCQIYFAPNHVRAWSRVAYDKAGGYDAAFPVADDHDLLCRTYLTGVPFVWIKQPLYMYRRHTNNTFTKTNALIKQLQTANMHKYLHDMIRVECKTNDLRMIDISTPEKCRPGCEAFDLLHSDYSTYLPENSVGCIYAKNILNHIPDSKFLHVMNNLYKMLIPGGWLLTNTQVSNKDENKVNSHSWTTDDFCYFTERRCNARMPGLDVRYQMVRLGVNYPPDSDKPHTFADMCALKGQRQPGEVSI
jgi:glycosyltransferase involved in cell wall biosynthesis